MQSLTCITAVFILIPAVFASSGSMDGHCMLQKKTRSRTVALEASRATAADATPVYGQAAKSLQAPPEGGSFSAFFNNRVEGPGIHKWLQYFPAYQKHLARFIGQEVYIMEIGIQSGGSMDMWKSVFGPGARVYGVDINPNCSVYDDERTRVFIGDQQNPEFWQNVTQVVPRIDILIDDGGHTVEQIIATLGIMLPHISPNGVYITEDIHGRENSVWHNLRFDQLDSPDGQRYTGLGSLVGSVHIYPYLLVLERNGSTSANAIAQQLGSSPSEQPGEVRTAVMGDSTSVVPIGSDMQLTLQDSFPWLHWDSEKIQSAGHLSMLMQSMKPNGWLFVRDGSSQFSLDARWDTQADEFLSKIVKDFKNMHEGTCCDWNATFTQQTVDSLHIYPHLLIAKRTDDRERLVKCPQHGTSWIPYWNGPGFNVPSNQTSSEAAA